MTPRIAAVSHDKLPQQGNEIILDTTLGATRVALPERQREGGSEVRQVKAGDASSDMITGPAESLEQTDPDPFTIGLGIFSAIAGGGAFLETRRARQFMERQQRESFRAAWFAARRTLIHFQQNIEEFETYMLEDGYSGMTFRIGAVRLTVDKNRHQAMRRLKGQSLIIANVLSDTLDDLSDYLGPEDQEAVGRILDRLGQIQIPDRYGDVIKLAREAHGLYQELLDAVGRRENFERATT